MTYHRIGYAGSSRVAGSVSLAQQAAHLVALMRHLGMQRAHLVGHSSGGNIILQLALDAPEMVGSLAVLEPALPVEASGSERLLSTRAFMAPVMERYRAGDKAGAVDGFMRGVTGPDYRVALDRVLPEAFGEAVASADTFFGQELPAVGQWSFRREDARRITQPVLAVVGEKSKAAVADLERPPGDAAHLAPQRRGIRPPRRHAPAVRGAPARAWPSAWWHSSPVTHSRRGDAVLADQCSRRSEPNPRIWSAMPLVRSACQRVMALIAIFCCTLLRSVLRLVPLAPWVWRRR